MDDGIFNIRKNLCVCCAHKGDRSIGKSVQVLTEENNENKQKVFHPVASRSWTFTSGLTFQHISQLAANPLPQLVKKESLFMGQDC